MWTPSGSQLPCSHGILCFLHKTSNAPLQSWQVYLKDNSTFREICLGFLVSCSKLDEKMIQLAAKYFSFAQTLKDWETAHLGLPKESTICLPTPLKLTLLSLYVLLFNFTRSHVKEYLPRYSPHKTTMCHFYSVQIKQTRYNASKGKLTPKSKIDILSSYLCCSSI